MLRFRPNRPPPVRRIIASLALTLVAGAVLVASELKPKTSAAYDHYVQVTEATMDANLAQHAMLTIDLLPEAKRTDIYARLNKGEVIVERVEAKDGKKSIDVPGGLIHDWRGIVWLPGVTLDRVLTMAQDYDHYDRIFKPAIHRSKLVERKGDTFVIQQRFVFKHILSGVVNATSEVVYTRVDATRAYLRSRSTRVVEVVDADTPKEAELPVGKDNGYLWRANAYWSMEERNGGTYLQAEWLTLSRDLPFGLGLFIGPIVRSVSRDTTQNTLIAARAALIPSAPVVKEPAPVR